MSQQAALRIGVDLGGTKIEALALEPSGREVFRKRVSTPRGDYEATIGAVTALVREIGAGPVGVGIPGTLSRVSGRVKNANSTWLIGQSLKEDLERALERPVRVENDANACAVAEVAWGAGAGASDVVYLKLSRGIGAGLVLDDRLYGGAAGTAGEIGHTTRSGDGELCRCGNRGCLETTAGSEAIARRAGRVDGAAVVAGAEAGDVACRRALRDAGTEIGLAAATICNILNPRRIVIGGELAAAWPFLAASFTAAVDRAAIHAAATSAEVRVGTLGARAEALGALALVLRDGDRFTVEMIGRTA